jgi:hypothetical protein
MPSFASDAAAQNRRISTLIAATTFQARVYAALDLFGQNAGSFCGLSLCTTR